MADDDIECAVEARLLENGRFRGALVRKAPNGAVGRKVEFLCDDKCGSEQEALQRARELAGPGVKVVN